LAKYNEEASSWLGGPVSSSWSQPGRNDPLPVGIAPGLEAALWRVTSSGAWHRGCEAASPTPTPANPINEEVTDRAIVAPMKRGIERWPRPCLVASSMVGAGVSHKIHGRTSCAIWLL
jgi:hypothetical protein